MRFDCSSEELIIAGDLGYANRNLGHRRDVRYFVLLIRMKTRVL